MYQIRKANISDIDAIKHLADAHRSQLGFVVRGALVEDVEKGWLLIAELPSSIIGFAHYRHRRDTQTTLYEICVAPESRKQGIGRVIVQTLVEEARVQGKALLRLKCPVDLPSNMFYQHLGFSLMKQEQGKRRVLNVWGMSLC